MKHGVKLDSIRTQDMSFYPWDEASYSRTNIKNHIIIHGDILDVQAGSADGGFCTCTHYTNKVAFQKITKSAGGLELWATRAKYDPATGDLLDCGFGQGLYCVAKPTEEFDCQDDLIVNCFANRPNNFSDNANAGNAYCRDTHKCKTDIKSFRKD